MNQPEVELKNHLNPTAIRILKKRLVSGTITPQVFKDILKQQMIKHYFRNYRHPLVKVWDKCLRYSKKTRKANQKTVSSSGQEDFETFHHKRF